MKMNKSNTSRIEAEELDLDAIATNMIEAQRQQAQAYRRFPLTYVKSVLGQLGKLGDVPVQDLSDELRVLVPQLSKREADRLVSLYLRGRPDHY